MEESRMPTERRGAGGNHDEFGRFLSELKHQGSALLVTGEVPPLVRAQALRQLLGVPNATPTRQRILVWVNTRIPLRKCLPTGVGPTDECLRLVTVSELVRTGTATDASPSSPELPPSVSQVTTQSSTTTISLTDGGLASVETAVSEAITECTEQAGTTAPGMIRVGIASLHPLLDLTENDGVVDLCDAIRSEMHACSGMAHFHLPVPDHDPLVDAFEDVVDARIELRHRDGLVPEQRWHTFNSVENTPEWIQL